MSPRSRRVLAAVSGLLALTLLCAPSSVASTGAKSVASTRPDAVATTAAESVASTGVEPVTSTGANSVATTGAKSVASAAANGWTAKRSAVPQMVQPGEAPAGSLQQRPAAVTSPTTPPAAPSTFITRSGSQLLLDGVPHQFTGVDAYELGTEWGINAGCGLMLTDTSLDDLFASLPAHSMVRTWFYQPMATNVQTGLRDWRPLDRVVAAAGRHGDYLIATLGDEGGVCDGNNYHDIGWYQQGWQSTVFNDDAQGLELTPYRQWVSDAVSRYQASPAIGMWELVNEPEASSCPSGWTTGNCGQVRVCPDEHTAQSALHGFLAAASAQIRSIDANHLISTGLGGSGGCGAQGADYGPVQDAPAVDVFSYHDYGNDAAAITPALSAAISAAQHAGRAIIAGEVGMMAGGQAGCVTLAERAAMLNAKRNTQLDAGVSAFLTWNWVPNTKPTPTPCGYDLNPGDPYLAP